MALAGGSSRWIGLALAVAMVTSTSAITALTGPPSRNTAPTYGRCVKATEDPEIFGPTALNAQSANGGLAVGFTEEATISVLRYPRPSFYDQIKYHTTTRDEPRAGVAPNEGAFLGLVADTATGRETTWLRTWNASQTYDPEPTRPGPGQEPYTDVVETRFVNDTLGLTATVHDVVAAPPDDVLVRDVVVEKAPDSPVLDAELVAFENLNLVVSKTPLFPTQDWCQEEENRDRARYLAGPDAIVHEKAGVDRSTGLERSVALGVAWRADSSAHQVGGDAHEPAANPAARTSASVQDAYEDAADGRLQGSDRYRGQTTGALAREVDLGPAGEPGRAEATLLLAGGADRGEAVDAIDRFRDRGFDAVAAEKGGWIRGLLAEAPTPAVPDDGDPSHGNVTELARRALATLATTVDRRSGAIVASIATQSPYGQDWIRDGAYFNEALHLVGLADWAEQRNRWYAQIQHEATEARDGALATPPGNWAMVYYADGVAGGPIPYEIDETGYGLWTLWRQYEVTGDLGYLRDVYPAIQRAGDFLVRHRDPATGLHAPAYEDDHFLVQERSIVGASIVRLGLASAAQAADVLGREDDRSRYENRTDELSAAIDAFLWDEAEASYGDTPAALTRPDRDHTGHPETAWPVCLDRTPTRFDRHLRAAWNETAPSFEEPTDANDRTRGLYESKTLLALAKWWKDRPGEGPKLGMADVREGLRWVADWHATNDTRVLGEVWVQDGNDVASRVSMPHVWEQTLFYLASLEAWPPEDAPADATGTPSCGGVVGALTPDAAGPAG